MNEVFLLGAGFSKAISPRMPLTRELGKSVLEVYKDADKIPSRIVGMIEGDLEQALTYLVQDKAWLPEAENLRQRALYLDLTNCIRYVLSRISRGTDPWPTNRPPMWLEALITYWHRNQSTVITLNYDTLIEQVASGVYWCARSTPIPTRKLYAISLYPAGLRDESCPVDYGHLNEVEETFTLLKLHGSINWFYSGRPDFFGEQLFYVPCEKGVDGPYDALIGCDPAAAHWRLMNDKTTLIVPPVLDKAIFFSTRRFDRSGSKPVKR